MPVIRNSPLKGYEGAFITQVGSHTGGRHHWCNYVRDKNNGGQPQTEYGAAQRYDLDSCRRPRYVPPRAIEQAAELADKCGASVCVHVLRTFKGNAANVAGWFITAGRAPYELLSYGVTEGRYDRTQKRIELLKLAAALIAREG